MVGRLTEHKGIVWALEALFAADLDLEVIVCGEGEQEASVEAFVDASKAGDSRVKVAFVGRVDQRERSKVIGSCDAVIVPSLVAENSPLVILEARAEGVPVVAAASGGIPELVPREGLFKVGDGRDLVTVLRRVLSNPCREGFGYTDQIPTVDSYARNLLTQTG